MALLEKNFIEGDIGWNKMIYATNNPNSRLRSVEGTVISSSDYEKEVCTKGYGGKMETFTRFSLDGMKDIFVIQGSLKVFSGQKVRFYEEDRHCKFVELAGIEVLSSEGKVERFFHARGYEFGG